ncbi:cupin domain-containing protein [Candidatus Dormiibacter inghamiae]
MGMHITRLADAKPFDPPGHRGVGPVRLQGGETAPTEGITVALSHYLPGGQAEMAPQPAETVYVVVAGELVVISEGTEETLRLYDSAHFTAGTLRQVTNRTQLPASILVIRPTGG